MSSSNHEQNVTDAMEIDTSEAGAPKEEYKEGGNTENGN